MSLAMALPRCGLSILAGGSPDSYGGTHVGKALPRSAGGKEEHAH